MVKMVIFYGYVVQILEEVFNINPRLKADNGKKKRLGNDEKSVLNRTWRTFHQGTH